MQHQESTSEQGVRSIPKLMSYRIKRVTITSIAVKEKIKLSTAA